MNKSGRIGFGRMFAAGPRARCGAWLALEIVVLAVVASSLAASGQAPSAPVALAQSPAAEITTRSQILEKEKELKEQALAKNGAASVKLSDYGNSFTMLAYRNKSGGAEVHTKFADFFYVVEGNATLETGGALVNPNNANPEEPRGDAIEGGSAAALRAGDFAHIPAGVPHRLIIPDGTDFCYFVIKVRER
ncbi:MAG: cupin domain-containing protein [Terracidiphilus sp.]